MSVFVPDWLLPEGFNAFVSTREGGVSLPPYNSLNVAMHVEDNPSYVVENRRRLPNGRNINWLEQTHSIEVVELKQNSGQVYVADASFTFKAGVVCAVMTADCLPLLIAFPQQKAVAAIHAGWRGLANGIIEACFEKMALPVQEAQVYLGPAIGADAFEVGEDVKQNFAPEDTQYFTPDKNQKYFADIYALARARLNRLGITNIVGGEYCTFTNEKQFFSYRRDGQTGRMVSYIWFD
ncbi:peptidoglycan editing factor PgeF [Neptunicella marina]|uniref:Purine nucleoside phosphorylase n=1 Tax=Neptunicella marina TaxID=2125989 RepID=A0A8J6M2I7_9ALTE|nr:peptidoglycan editing factor PgeF [Neptunicella marina]MBC3767904.1 peptidoglycan editing factor PgeF [Neptunicella marina]